MLQHQWCLLARLAKHFMTASAQIHGIMWKFRENVPQRTTTVMAPVLQAALVPCGLLLMQLLKMCILNQHDTVVRRSNAYFTS